MPRKWMENHTTEFIMSAEWGTAAFLLLSFPLPYAFLKIKDAWLLGRKAMTNLDSILKSRDVTLPTKVRLVNAMIFPIVMNGCESWTIKKAECRRIDAFELWGWRRLLGVPWTEGDPNSPS